MLVRSRGGPVEGDDDQHGGRELSPADGGDHAAFTGQDRRWLIAGAALKLAIYVAWMLGHDEFLYVIYDYGSTLAFLLLLVLAERTRGIGGHRAYIATGIWCRLPPPPSSRAAFAFISISITTI